LICGGGIDTIIEVVKRKAQCRGDQGTVSRRSSNSRRKWRACWMYALLSPIGTPFGQKMDTGMWGANPHPQINFKLGKLTKKYSEGWRMTDKEFKRAVELKEKIEFYEENKGILKRFLSTNHPNFTIRLTNRRGKAGIWVFQNSWMDYADIPVNADTVKLIMESLDLSLEEMKKEFEGIGKDTDN